MTDSPEQFLVDSTSKVVTPLRFTQVVQVRSAYDNRLTLVGLTPQGSLYERYYDEDSQMTVWRPVLAFSSTELPQDEDLVCSDCKRSFANGIWGEPCPICCKGFLKRKTGPVPPCEI